jgi:hypothetical protein
MPANRNLLIIAAIAAVAVLAWVLFPEETTTTSEPTSLAPTTTAPGK